MCIKLKIFLEFRIKWGMFLLFTDDEIMFLMLLLYSNALSLLYIKKTVLMHNVFASSL